MDPLTAALNLANTIAQIILISVQSQPPDVRAEYAKAQLDAFHQWQALIERFLPK